MATQKLRPSFRQRQAKVGKNLSVLTQPGPKITYKEMESLNPALALRISRALKLYKAVLVSPAFKKFVLNHTYLKNGKRYKGFVDDRGWSRQKIYDHIMSQPHEIWILAYWENTGTIGWGYPTDTITRINKKFYDTMTDYAIASNLFHEELHDLGFKHDFKLTPTRRYSVPYALGYYMKRAAKKLANKAVV